MILQQKSLLIGKEKFSPGASFDARIPLTIEPGANQKQTLQLDKHVLLQEFSFECAAELTDKVTIGLNFQSKTPLTLKLNNTNHETMQYGPYRVFENAGQLVRLSEVIDNKIEILTESNELTDIEITIGVSGNHLAQATSRIDKQEASTT